VFSGWLAIEGERENPNPMDRVEADSCFGARLCVEPVGHMNKSHAA
jgi:hypothetical protein